MYVSENIYCQLGGLVLHAFFKQYLQRWFCERKDVNEQIFRSLC